MNMKLFTILVFFISFWIWFFLTGEFLNSPQWYTWTANTFRASGNSFLNTLADNIESSHKIKKVNNWVQNLTGTTMVASCKIESSGSELPCDITDNTNSGLVSTGANKKPDEEYFNYTGSSVNSSTSATDSGKISVKDITIDIYDSNDYAFMLYNKEKLSFYDSVIVQTGAAEKLWINDDVKVYDLFWYKFVRKIGDLYTGTYYLSGYILERKHKDDFEKKLIPLVSDIFNDPVKFELFKKNIFLASNDFKVLKYSTKEEYIALFDEYLKNINSEFKKILSVYNIEDRKWKFTDRINNFDEDIKNDMTGSGNIYGSYIRSASNYERDDRYIDVGLALYWTIIDGYSNEFYNEVIVPVLDNKEPSFKVSQRMKDVIKFRYDLVMDEGVGPSWYGDDDTERYNEFGSKVLWQSFKKVNIETQESFKETLKSGNIYLGDILDTRDTELELLDWIGTKVKKN